MVALVIDQNDCTSETENETQLCPEVPIVMSREPNTDTQKKLLWAIEKRMDKVRQYQGSMIDQSFGELVA